MTSCRQCPPLPISPHFTRAHPGWTAGMVSRTAPSHPGLCGVLSVLKTEGSPQLTLGALTSLRNLDRLCYSELSWFFFACVIVLCYIFRIFYFLLFFPFPVPPSLPTFPSPLFCSLSLSSFCLINCKKLKKSQTLIQGYTFSISISFLGKLTPSEITAVIRHDWELLLPWKRAQLGQIDVHYNTISRSPNHEILPSH